MNRWARYAEAYFYFGANRYNLKIDIDEIEQIGAALYFAIIANPVTQQALTYGNEWLARITNMGWPNYLLEPIFIARSRVLLASTACMPAFQLGMVSGQPKLCCTTNSLSALM